MMEAYKTELIESRGEEEELTEREVTNDVRLSITTQEGIETHLRDSFFSSNDDNFIRRRTPRLSLSTSSSFVSPPNGMENTVHPTTANSESGIRVYFAEPGEGKESDKESWLRRRSARLLKLPFIFGVNSISRDIASNPDDENQEAEIDLSSFAGYDHEARGPYERTETDTEGQSTYSPLTEPTKSLPDDDGDVPKPPPSVSTNSGSLHHHSGHSPGIRSRFQAPHRPPTKLHEICANAKTCEDLVDARKELLKLKLDRKKILNFAHVRDGRGRNPMHLIAENKQIAEDLVKAAAASPSFEEENDSLSWFPNATATIPHQTTLFDGEKCREKIVEDFVIDFLLAASPGAAMSRDNHGYIPFERVLTGWVNQHYDEMLHSKSFRSKRDSFAATAPKAVMSALRYSISKAPGGKSIKGGGVGSSSAFQSPDLERGGSVTRTRGLNDSSKMASSSSRLKDNKLQTKEVIRNKCFPVQVHASSHVMFALKMLSKTIERLEKLSIEGRSASKKLVPSESLISADSFDKIFRESVAGACAYSDIQEAIVSSIASIPDIVKLVMLIDDEEERESILSMTIMRRVLMNKHSIGTWLTAMLQSGENKRVSSRAISYLKLVSDVSTASVQLSKEAVSSSNLSGTKRHRDEVTNEISQLRGFVPSLLALGERGVEEAATSMVVRRVMDRIISRPFSILFIVCDAVFLALLLFGFRSAVNNLLVRGKPNVIMRGIYTANAGIFYFIIREIGKAISLCMVTKSPRMYLWSFWNLTDLSATVLALISIMSIRSVSQNEDGDIHDMDALRNLLAVTTGFLWLRVLNLLKGINMQMATFILAILQITKDTLSFGVILLTMVITFGQMFYTVLIPEYCSAEQSVDDSEHACDQNEYFFRVYTVLLGDFGSFERGNFRTQFALLLLIFYSFMVIIVLLNVLIAVASDSYEKCLLKSQMLFGRARVMLIAELVCFQSLLRKNPEALPLLSKAPITYCCPSKPDSGWSRGSLAFFGLSSLVIVLWAVGEMAGSLSGERYGGVAVSLWSILINVVVFAAMMVFLSRGADDNLDSKHTDLIQTDSSDSAESSHLQPSCLQKCMLRVMGSSQNSWNFRERDKKAGEEWQGRVHHLQTRIDMMAKDSLEQSKKQAQELEQAVANAESRLQGEMHVLDQRMESLTKGLLIEIRQLHDATLNHIESAMRLRQRSGGHQDLLNKNE